MTVVGRKVWTSSKSGPSMGTCFNNAGALVI